MFETHVIIFLVWLALCLLVTVVSFTISIVRYLRDKNWETWGTIVGCIAGVVTVLSFLVASFTLFPYQPKYWSWETKEGLVAYSEYDAKADQSSRNSWEKGGLRMELLDGTSFFTQDFRLADKRPGQLVKLVCKPTFQSGNVDRLDCRSQIGST